MKKLTIILAMAAIAALATAGQFRHPSNPFTVQGAALSTTTNEWPFPACPPDCAIAKHQPPK